MVSKQSIPTVKKAGHGSWMAEQDKANGPKYYKMCITGEDGTPVAWAKDKATAELIVKAPDMAYLLQQIMGALPSNRDWLDPDIERAIKALI